MSGKQRYSTLRKRREIKDPMPVTCLLFTALPWPTAELHYVEWSDPPRRYCLTSGAYSQVGLPI